MGKWSSVGVGKTMRQPCGVLMLTAVMAVIALFGAIAGAVEYRRVK